MAKRKTFTIILQLQWKDLYCRWMTSWTWNSPLGLGQMLKTTPIAAMLNFYLLCTTIMPITLSTKKSRKVGKKSCENATVVFCFAEIVFVLF